MVFGLAATGAHSASVGCLGISVLYGRGIAVASLQLISMCSGYLQELAAV